MARFSRDSAIIAVVLSVYFCVALAIKCPHSMTGLDRCECTWNDTIHTIDAVICKNLEHTDHSALRSLEHTQSITRLEYTGNNIVELQSNIFGNCSAIHLLNLAYIDFSNNRIQIIHGQSFHCVPNVRTLKLNDNMWVVDPSHVRVFSSMSRLEHLELENAFRSVNDSMPNTIPLQAVFAGSYMDSLKELHLEHNAIRFIGSKTFCKLPKLDELHLSGNELEKINLECLDSLRELFIGGNNIKSLTKADIDSLGALTNLRRVDLSDNPYQCNDCAGWTAYFRDWLKRTTKRIIIEKSTVTCANPELEDVKIVDLTDEDLKGTCPHPNAYQKKSKSRAIITGVILGIIGILTIVVLYINRRSIRKGTAKWIAPIRNSAIVKRMHFGYRNMQNDSYYNDKFSGMNDNDDEATFSSVNNDDATTYAAMDTNDATTYATMENNTDTEPVVS